MNEWMHEWMNCNERTGIVNWNEWIGMNELKWMNVNEWMSEWMNELMNAEMNELLEWMKWNEMTWNYMKWTGTE